MVSPTYLLDLSGQLPGQSLDEKHEELIQRDLGIFHESPRAKRRLVYQSWEISKPPKRIQCLVYRKEHTDKTELDLHLQ